MAFEIHRRYGGTHPTKKNHPRSYWKPGQPMDCSAQVLIIAQDNKIAISMNGTAVLSWVELIELVREIGDGLDEC